MTGAAPDAPSDFGWASRRTPWLIGLSGRSRGYGAAFEGRTPRGSHVSSRWGGRSKEKHDGRRGRSRTVAAVLEGHYEQGRPGAVRTPGRGFALHVRTGGKKEGWGSVSVGFSTDQPNVRGAGHEITCNGIVVGLPDNGPRPTARALVSGRDDRPKRAKGTAVPGHAANTVSPSIVTVQQRRGLGGGPSALLADRL